MADSKSNILLVTVDCFRYDRCGFAGHNWETTPTLDSLAEESYLFEQAYSTGTYTTEAVPGMISGHHSYNSTYFGADPAWKAIPADSATIASHLNSFGYATTAVLTNPHLTSERNFDSGFDYFRNLRMVNGADRAAASQTTDSSVTISQRIQTKLRSSGLLDSVPVITAGRAYQYVSGWPSVRGSTLINSLFNSFDPNDTPFFAWTHLMDIHRPLHPDTTAQGESRYSPSRSRQFQIDAHAATDSFDPRFEALYDNAVRYVDDRINDIIEWLQEKDAWDDTILIVTGDHGEALFDRGRYGHPRHYPYDELLHVPLVVRDPDGTSKRLSQPFSMAWLGELITELIEVSPPPFPAKSGRSTHLREDPDEEIAIISDALDSHGHSVAVSGPEHKYVTRKLTEDANPDVVSTPTEGGFKVSIDRGEYHLLDPVEVPKHLRETAESVMSSPSELTQAEGGFSPDVERQLEQLGYKM